MRFLRSWRRTWRSLMRTPAATIAAVVSLALGIGGATAVATLLATLFAHGASGVGDAKALIALYVRDPGQGPYGTWSYPDYRDLADPGKGAPCCAAIAAQQILPLTVSVNGAAKRTSVALVSPNYFTVLRTRLPHGRGFSAEEGRPGAAPVAVISHGLSQRLLGMTPNLSRARLLVSGVAFQVLGVAPEGFRGWSLYGDAEIWIPAADARWIAGGYLPPDLVDNRDVNFFEVVGRLKPGVSLARAKAELDGRRLPVRQGDSPTHPRTVGLGDWRDVTLGPLHAPTVHLASLFAVATIAVFIIALVNAGSLLMARALASRTELAVKVALGASRLQIASQLAGESLLLALVSAVLGLVFERLTLGLLVGLALPVASTDLQFDARALLLTLAVTLVTALLFGLVPALVSSRQDPALAIRGSATQSLGRRPRELGWIIVVAETALAFVALVLTYLILVTLRNEVATDPGFDPHHVAVVQFDLQSRHYSPAQRGLFYAQMLQRVRSDRRVTAAGLARFLPFPFDDNATTPVFRPGEVPTKNLQQYPFDVVSPGFFTTLRIPLLRGRSFAAGGGRDEVIVDQALAQALWPGQEAVGQRVSLLSPAGPYLTVVGVARDIRSLRLREKPGPYFYVGFDPSLVLPVGDLTSSMALVARTRGDARLILSDLAHTARSIDPEVEMPRLTTLGEHMAELSQGTSAQAKLLSMLGAMALLLAAAGLYGALLHNVMTRRRAIAIRMALGEAPSSILLRVLGRGALLTLGGSLIGCLLSFPATSLLRAQFYGVGTSNLIAGSVCAAVLVGIGLLASLLPARQARASDVNMLLRQG
jgi:putative ABC transport system permease protein